MNPDSDLDLPIWYHKFSQQILLTNFIFKVLSEFGSSRPARSLALIPKSLYIW